MNDPNYQRFKALKEMSGLSLSQISSITGHSVSRPVLSRIFNGKPVNPQVFLTLEKHVLDILEQRLNSFFVLESIPDDSVDWSLWGKKE